MGVNDWSQAEKDLYAIGTRALFDDMERARESVMADLDLYRNDATTRYADQLREHEDRVRQMRDDQAAWLANFINGEPAPTDPQQGQVVHPPGSSPAASLAGPGPAGQPPITDDIRAMPMDEYAALRARIGMGNASGRGLFG